MCKLKNLLLCLHLSKYFIDPPAIFLIVWFPISGWHLEIDFQWCSRMFMLLVAQLPPCVGDGPNLCPYIGYCTHHLNVSVSLQWSLQHRDQNNIPSRRFIAELHSHKAIDLFCYCCLTFLPNIHCGSISIMNFFHNSTYLSSILKLKKKKK